MTEEQEIPCYSNLAEEWRANIKATQGRQDVHIKKWVDDIASKVSDYLRKGNSKDFIVTLPIEAILIKPQYVDALETWAKSEELNVRRQGADMVIYP